MNSFSGSAIDTPPLIARVINLFRNHNRLVWGFKAFLEGGYKRLKGESRNVSRERRKEAERRAQELLRTLQEPDDRGDLKQQETTTGSGLELPSCPFCVADYDTDLLLLSSETNKLPSTGR
jgi:hypothetical protein